MKPVIYAVGIGPGNLDCLTRQARDVLEKATVIAGYKLYLDLIAPLTVGKKVISGAMKQEVSRCREALAAALAGETVAVIGSGDAGVYGMAGLLLELTEQEPFQEISVRVIPGVTGALAAAALVGAPLMNDFAVLSLSDLMTPRETILKRLECTARAGLVTVLYNPAGTKRKELLPQALAIFRRHGGNLPAALVRNAGREGEYVHLCHLDDFPVDAVQMTSIVILGNPDSVLRGNCFYVRRGYREKYELDR